MKIGALLKAIWCCAVLLCFLQTGPAGASTSNLTVVIKGIKNGNGQILVCLFNSAAGFPACESKGIFKRFGTKARSGSLSFVMKQLPDGIYAISVAHDQNGDNKIDRHFLFGYPTEGAGTSNYPKPPRSKPTYDQASFRLTGGAASVEIMMHYP